MKQILKIMLYEKVGKIYIESEVIDNPYVVTGTLH